MDWYPAADAAAEAKPAINNEIMLIAIVNKGRRQK
jgi:hypothetical protein